MVVGLLQIQRCQWFHVLKQVGWLVHCRFARNLQNLYQISTKFGTLIVTNNVIIMIKISCSDFKWFRTNLFNPMLLMHFAFLL